MRITTERYLALALIEAERGVDILLNQLRAAAGRQYGRLSTFLEIEKFQAARDALEARIKPMREDKSFSSDLTLTRNEVFAHFVSKESGVENSAKWALSRAALRSDEDAILRSKIVEFSIALSIGLRELSQGMTAASAAWMVANHKKQILSGCWHVDGRVGPGQVPAGHRYCAEDGRGHGLLHRGVLAVKTGNRRHRLRRCE